jgi:Cu/Ag efflux pump CusA
MGEVWKTLPQIFAVMIPIVGAIALFSFLAVASQAEERRKAEEAKAKYEFLKKMTESQGFDVQKYMQYQEAELSLKEKQTVEKRMLSGLILVAVGLGISVFLYFVAGHMGVWTVGIIPLAIGAALIVAAVMKGRAMAARG